MPQQRIYQGKYRWPGTELIPPSPPPPSGDVGPPGSGTLAQRVQAVRDGTMPLAVSVPGGTFTTVAPGDNIVTKRNAAGVGGTLWFTKGTYTLTAAVAPLAGQSWIFESAAGFTRTAATSAIFDGANGILSQLIFCDQPNVTIRGGVFQRQGNASSPNNTGAIINTATGFLLEDAICQDNWFRGFAGGDGTVARRCYFTRNGNMGFSGGGGSNEVYQSIRVEDNNTRELDPGNQGGAFKIRPGSNVQLLDSWIHDNRGFGAWWDSQGTGSDRNIAIGNVIEHNWLAGLFFEGPWGGCKAQRNYIVNNGYYTGTIGTVGPAPYNDSQFRITHADQSLGVGVRGDISQNYFDYTLPQDADHGCHLLLWNHEPPWPNNMKNWDIHDNEFWMRAAQTRRIRGEDQGVSVNGAFDPNLQVWEGDIDFYDNTYYVQNTTTAFWMWGTGDGPAVSTNYTAWKGFHPGETGALVVL